MLCVLGGHQQNNHVTSHTDSVCFSIPLLHSHETGILLPLQQPCVWPHGLSILTKTRRTADMPTLTLVIAVVTSPKRPRDQHQPDVFRVLQKHATKKEAIVSSTSNTHCQANGEQRYALIPWRKSCMPSVCTMHRAKADYYTASALKKTTRASGYNCNIIMSAHYQSQNRPSKDLTKPPSHTRRLNLRARK